MGRHGNHERIQSVALVISNSEDPARHRRAGRGAVCQLDRKRKYLAAMRLPLDIIYRLTYRPLGNALF